MRFLALLLALAGPVSALQGTFPASGPATGASSRVRYGELVTRLAERDGREQPAVLRYVVHTPIGTPRGLAVLLPDETGLRGDRVTGRVHRTPEDFLFEQAPLFAEQGFLTLVVDRTSTEDGLSADEYDLFRLSAAHAQDLATVIRAENRDGHDVFFVARGRGTLSAVAQHRLARAIALFQPITSGTGLVLGDPEVPSLQPSSVTVPVHLMSELGVASGVTSPRNALDLELEFLLAGVPAAFSLLDTDPLEPGALESSPVEGHFLLDIGEAIDTRAVAKIGRFLTLVQLWDETMHPGNEAPLAGGTTLRIACEAGDEAIELDLSTLALDPEGGTLTFSLPHAVSSRGAELALVGDKVTYTPSEKGLTDGFVFGVSDGRGKKIHEVVVVTVE